MRPVRVLIVAFSLLSGCDSKPPIVELPRPAVTLDSVRVDTHGAPRSFFLSDRTGGFLVGHTALAPVSVSWSVDGAAILDAIDIVDNDIAVPRDSDSRTTVYPTRVDMNLADGHDATISLVSFRDQSTLIHALRVDIRGPGTGHVRVAPRGLGSQWKEMGSATVSSRRWQNLANGRVVQQYSLNRLGSTSSPDSVEKGNSTSVLFLYSESSVALTPELFTTVEESLHAREERLLRELNTLYVRTGDPRLNRAMWWTKATLDGLVVEGVDTTVVSSLPWNGVYSGRSIARSLTGLLLAESHPHVIGSIIRWLAATQEKREAQSAFGRIAKSFTAGSRDYSGADVGPDFVRQVYEYISMTKDTAMIRDMYPVLRRSISGTMRYHLDSLGFLVHGDHETWMDDHNGSSGPLRGNRAVEIQSAWYYQQLIGSFLAEWVGDSAAQRRWAEGAGRTAASFNKCFVDSVRNLLFDHITASGDPIAIDRPNALYCLDLLRSEHLQQNIIRRTMEHNIFRRGVGTLSPDDPHFGLSVGSSQSPGQFNGPIWAWLNAQAIYSLTRYDREDLAFAITDHQVGDNLDRGMVGSLPPITDVTIVDGEHGLEAEGAIECSIDAEAEFLRGIYQDYLGITVDAPAHEISLHPKLPGILLPIDCTVFLGPHPLRITYQSRGGVFRASLDAPDLRKPLKVQFLFILESGVAWKGTTVLVPGRKLMIGLDDDNAISFRGDEEIKLKEVVRLPGFSQRQVFTGLHFADEKLERDSSGVKAAN